jgi:predicted RNA methylase
MASHEMMQRFSEKTTLKLGAGCGVPELAAAHYRQGRSYSLRLIISQFPDVSN